MLSFKKYIIPLIWCLAVIFAVGSELMWSHFPIEYREAGLRLTFNSMMDHLLHGHFDVDPDFVGLEGFSRSGKVYAYWGIFPALLRLPFLFFSNGLYLDITRLSCISALLIMLYFNYSTWKVVFTKYVKNNFYLSVMVAIAFSFSGEQVCFFQHTLYQEVCLWGLAFASWFVYWAVRTVFEQDGWLLGSSYMAIAAGGALLTRVSMGIGLYVALFFMIILYSLRWYKKRDIELKTIIFPVVFSFFFLIVTGFVNYSRWGNPLTFVNYDFYLFNKVYPSRILRTKEYGLFNFDRFFLGFIYYFFPIWVVMKNDGTLFFQKAFIKIVDANELPPSSFFLTDGFLLLLCYYGTKSIIVNSSKYLINKLNSTFIILSFLIPPFLMMLAISMNYRYRGEFYPVMVFVGILGCVFIGNMHESSKKLSKLLLFLLVISVFFSNFVSIIYQVTRLGPSYDLLGHGIVSYYKSRF